MKCLQKLSDVRVGLPLHTEGNVKNFCSRFGCEDGIFPAVDIKFEFLLISMKHLEGNIAVILFFSLFSISVYFENKEWGRLLPIDSKSLEEQSIEENV